MINYSIIIPHYNTPDLLERCLASIPERKDIQIIIVDDKSDPAIVDFKHFPGKERKHVELFFNKKGGSAGRARNIGLQQVRGKWILFADADDYFLQETFDILDEYVNTDYDIVFFNIISRYSDTGTLATRNEEITKILHQFDTSKEQTVNDLRYNHDYPTAKLIKKKLVIENNLQFDEVRWANDVMFSTKIGYYAAKIQVDLRPIYCLTVTHGSLVNQISLESRLCRYEVMLRVNQFLRSVGKTSCQHSIMYSLRRAYRYGGIKALWQFILLGIQYNANFFIGWQSWLKNAFYNEEKGKEKYIIKS